VLSGQDFKSLASFAGGIQKNAAAAAVYGSASAFDPASIRAGLAVLAAQVLEVQVSTTLRCRSGHFVIFGCRHNTG
jgi:hypothetical protein